MTDISLNDVHNSLKELRDTHEKGAEKLDALDLAKIEKCNKFLDLQEEKNQEIAKKLQEEKSAREEMEAKYDALEAQIKAPNLSGDSKAQVNEELKAFDSMLRKGDKSMEAAEFKLLRTDNDADGGYLVPDPLEGEIIKKITEISPIESVARVVTMGSKTSSTPARTALVSVGMVGEAQQDASSNSTYGKEMLVAKKGQVTVETTVEELQDASYNVFNEISTDVAESMAQLRGSQFVNGSAAGNNCEGIMVNADVATINSGSASTFGFDNLITLTGELKTGYDAIYGMNRKTIAFTRALKDGAGAYIWRAGNLGAGIPNSINGVSYIEIPDLADIGADTFPVIYGDFRRGYKIGNRIGMTMIRDEFTRKREGIIELTFYQRFAGKVVLPEAFIKLKCAV
jgi:HK97 family phage major capsid protein